MSIYELLHVVMLLCTNDSSVLTDTSLKVKCVDYQMKCAETHYFTLGNTYYASVRKCFTLKDTK